MTDQQAKDLLAIAKSIDSSLLDIKSDISDIKTSLKDKNTPLIKSIASLEQYIIGLIDK